MIGWFDPEYFKAHRAALETLRRQYPGNYQFQACEVRLQRLLNDYPAALQASQTVVRCAPETTDAWLTLAYSLSDQANAIRQGRIAAALSESETALVMDLYVRCVAAASRAAMLDSLYGKAWLQTASAATFDGDGALADAAFWRAVELDPDDPDVYFWGLQMFQPKWGGAPEKLAQVARLVACHRFGNSSAAIRTGEYLAEQGFWPERRTLLDNAIRQWQDAVRKDPHDSAATYYLAAVLSDRGRVWDAVPLFRDYIRMQPQDFWGYYGLATAYDKISHSADAAAAYQQALRINPDYGPARAALAHDLGAMPHPDRTRTTVSRPTAP